MEGGVQKVVKHNLSSSSAKLPSHITDPENVKESTEIIFKILLKDSYKKSERVISQNTLETEDETIPSLKKQDSFGLDLDLPTDIESDAISSSEDDIINKVAERLGEIGDDFARQFENWHMHCLHKYIGRVLSEMQKNLHWSQIENVKHYWQREANKYNREGSIGEKGTEKETHQLVLGKTDFEQSLISCAQKATTESIYQQFEKSLDTFLEDQKKYLPDSSDQYQVALVLLCTKTALRMANKPITAASNSADIVISNAVNFVSNRFPRWLGGIQ